MATSPNRANRGVTAKPKASTAGSRAVQGQVAARNKSTSKPATNASRAVQGQVAAKSKPKNTVTSTKKTVTSGPSKLLSAAGKAANNSPSVKAKPKPLSAGKAPAKPNSVSKTPTAKSASNAAANYGGGGDYSDSGFYGDTGGTGDGGYAGGFDGGMPAAPEYQPFDPAAINKIYDPSYEAIKQLRTSGQGQYDTGDTKLKDLYAALVGDINKSNADVTGAYSSARDQINADTETARANIERDSGMAQGQQSALMRNLGLQAAAPGLNANREAVSEAKNTATTTGLNSANLVSGLGANASAFVTNTGNAANAGGVSRRGDLLTQFQDYINQLGLKQTEVDSQKAQALFTGEQSWNAGQASSAENARQIALEQQKLQQDATQFQQTQENDRFKLMFADQAAQRDAAAKAALTQSTADPYANMLPLNAVQNAAQQYGVNPNNAATLIQQAYSRAGSGTMNVNQFKALVAQMNAAAAPNAKIDSLKLADLAQLYWDKSGTKSGTPTLPVA